MRLLDRQRRQADAGSRLPLADLDRLAGPGALHQVERLGEALPLRARIDSEGREQRRPEAAAEAEDHPPVRDPVEHRDLLRGLEGVADRQQVGGRAEPQLLRPRRGGGEDDQGRRAGCGAGEVALRQEERVEPEPVGELRLLGDGGRLVAQVVDPGGQPDLDVAPPPPVGPLARRRTEAARMRARRPGPLGRRISRPSSR